MKAPQLYTFSNGLRLVYQKPENNVPTTSIMVFCDLGSAYEREGLRGISHFIEHMCFKGTAGLKRTRDISKQFDETGAFFNAYTEKRYTYFTVNCPDVNLAHSIDVLSDMMLRSSFLKEDVDMELNVVKEEMRRAQDDYSGVLYDITESAIYDGTPYKHPVDDIQYHEETPAFRYEDVVATYKTFYRPENMVVSVVSLLPFEKVLRMVKKTHYAKGSTPFAQGSTPFAQGSTPFAQGSTSFAKGSTPFAQDTVTRMHAAEKSLRIISLNDLPHKNHGITLRMERKKNVSAAHIAVSFRTCNQKADEMWPLEILRNIVGGYMSSRLFLLLREQHGLTYSQYVSTQYREAAGDFTIHASTDPKKILRERQEKRQTKRHRKEKEKRQTKRYRGGSAKVVHGQGVLPIIIGMLRDLLKHGVTKQEFELAKHNMRGSHLQQMDRKSNYASYNGHQVLLYNCNKINSFSDIYDDYIRPVKIQQVNEAMRRYFVPDKMFVCILGSSLPSEAAVRRAFRPLF